MIERAHPLALSKAQTTAVVSRAAGCRYRRATPRNPGPAEERAKLAAIAEVLARVSARPQTSPPEWPRLVFWALLDAGYEALRRNIAPRVEIVDAIMASLTAGTITPDQS